MTTENRRKTLEVALEAVTKDRNQDYGDPEDNFQTIAELWEAYTGWPFSRADVAVMMILVKASRIMTSPAKQDHWIDIAGYAACGYGSSLADKADKETEINRS